MTRSSLIWRPSVAMTCKVFAQLASKNRCCIAYMLARRGLLYLAACPRVTRSRRIWNTFFFTLAWLERRGISSCTSGFSQSGCSLRMLAWWNGGQSWVYVVTMGEGHIGNDHSCRLVHLEAPELCGVRASPSAGKTAEKVKIEMIFWQRRGWFEGSISNKGLKDRWRL
jgi:hypothetical protein